LASRDYFGQCDFNVNRLAAGGVLEEQPFRLLPYFNRSQFMKSQFAAGFVVLGLALAPVAFAADKAMEKSAPTTTETVKDAIKDSIITTKIKAEYAKDKAVSAMNIKVDTDDKGVVTLSGNAKSKDEAAKAESIAKSVSGVTMVKNNIQFTASTKK
jgi:hyperosmotically inducible periplasmic protein